MRQAVRRKALSKAWLVGLAASGLVLASGCTVAGTPTGTEGWKRTAPVPSGFVNEPLTVWVDGAFVVIGGSSEVADRPQAHTQTAGSRLDPASGTWTAITDAPVGLSQSDAHVVVGGVLYVAPTTLKDLKKSPGGGPWVCDQQGFYSYNLAANTWAELALPSGVCSLDPKGLVATSDAIVALSTGSRASWGESEPQWSQMYPRAVDAVFDVAAKTWTLTKAPAQKDAFRWGTWTPVGLVVAVEKLPPAGAFTNTSPATPAVYSWDYRADTWTQLDRAGSATVDWKQWTGRIQDSSGPIYYQDGKLLTFDAVSGTFTGKQATCGRESCAALNAESSSSFGTGVSDLGVFADGWTLTVDSSGQAAYWLRPSTGETSVLFVPTAADPKRTTLDAVAMAGGPGVALSCPIAPRTLPKASYVEDLGATIAPLTLDDNAGTGQPSAMIRVALTAADQPTPTLEELAIGADGKWQYVDTASRPAELTVQSVDYVHKQDMQPYCYLLHR
jgi:hypothetical protein